MEIMYYVILALAGCCYMNSTEHSTFFGIMFQWSLFLLLLESIINISNILCRLSLCGYEKINIRNYIFIFNMFIYKYTKWKINYVGCVGVVISMGLFGVQETRQ